MTTLALNSLSRSSLRSPLFSSASVKPTQAGPQFRKRWLHQTLSRQAIMMPAMSPFMTTGTITRWNKKEGEAFAAGDVLLQIESDIAVIDVEAETSGVLGKILLPDGSQNVPVEQVIALVTNERDLSNLSYQVGPTPPPYNPIPSPPSRAMPSPVRTEVFNQPFLSPTHRSPTLAEMHHGHHHHRGMATHHARGQKLTIVPPSPRLTVSLPILDRSTASAKLHTAASASPIAQIHQESEKTSEIQDSPVDGAAIRRMFRSNLSRAPLSAVSYSSPLTADTKDYFDGIL
ncbi:hypothetical protein H0H87_012543 [Tephrocybe sp. NHM501043]|nr:hypothetical protein H0H87_012543 [Tephrocybe sp. NHM501043]